MAGYTKYLEDINSAQRTQIAALFEVIEDYRAVVEAQTKVRDAEASAIEARAMGSTPGQTLYQNRTIEIISLMGGEEFIAKVGKINSIKLVRAMTGAGLRDAKDIVESFC
jgi:ribosomal protein L7/L12